MVACRSSSEAPHAWRAPRSRCNRPLKDSPSFRQQADAALNLRSLHHFPLWLAERLRPSLLPAFLRSLTMTLLELRFGSVFRYCTPQEWANAGMLPTALSNFEKRNNIADTRIHSWRGCRAILTSVPSQLLNFTSMSALTYAVRNHRLPRSANMYAVPAILYS